MRMCRCKTDMVSPGVKEADRLNLETFIEATDLGKLTYEACGLVYAGTNYLETAKRNASPEWKALERDMQYVYFFECLNVLVGGLLMSPTCLTSLRTPKCTLDLY